MLENLDTDQMNRLWEYGKHEEEMFTQKLNFFLVFESVLLGVVGLLYSRPEPMKVVLICIVSFGLLLTILWEYVQAEQLYIYEEVLAITKDTLPEYRFARLRIERVKWPISPMKLLTYGVPIIVGCIWMILLTSVIFF